MAQRIVWVFDTFFRAYLRQIEKKKKHKKCNAIPRILLLIMPCDLQWWREIFKECSVRTLHNSPALASRRSIEPISYSRALELWIQNGLRFYIFFISVHILIYRVKYATVPLTTTAREEWNFVASDNWKEDVFLPVCHHHLSWPLPAFTKWNIFPLRI